MGSPKPTLEEIKEFLEFYVRTNNFSEAARAIGRSAWEMEAYFESDKQAQAMLKEARLRLRDFAKSKLWEGVEDGKIEAIKLALRELDPSNYGPPSRELTVRHKFELDEQTQEVLRSLPSKKINILPKPEREVLDAEVIDE